MTTAIVSSINSYIEEIRALMESGVMVENIHYGKIPGTDKPTLLVAGAQLLCALFELTPRITLLKEESHADYERMIFDFVYQCEITRRSDGQVLSITSGSCSSLETKYGYRWVTEDQVPSYLDKSKLAVRNTEITEFAFAIENAETSGPYGKPAEYWKRFQDEIDAGTAVKGTKKSSKGKELNTWSIGGVQYRIPNPEVGDLLNTLRKMAQKRTLVGGVLLATGASAFFTQDVEDMPQMITPKEEIVKPDWNMIDSLSTAFVRAFANIDALLESLELEPRDSNLWARKTTDEAINIIASQLFKKKIPLYPNQITPRVSKDKTWFALECGFGKAALGEADDSVPEFEAAALGEIKEIPFDRGYAILFGDYNAGYYRAEPVESV